MINAGRIAARFAQLRTEGRGALMPFLEAYDPDPATSMAIGASHSGQVVAPSGGS